MDLARDRVTVFEDMDIDFSVQRILDTPPFPRWKESAHSGEDLQATVSRLRDVVWEALAPRAMYRVLPLERTSFREYDPPSKLLDGEYVVPGVVTIGEGEYDPHVEESLFDNLVIDGMENVALQFARSEVIGDIRESANSAELNTTRVLPPGTRGSQWPLKNRAVIFEHLPTEQIDVFFHDQRVTEPRKTFTFAMGLGSNISQAELLLSCGDCEYIEECAYVGTTVA